MSYNVSVWPGCFSYLGITQTVHVPLKFVRIQTRPWAGVYDCSVEEKREQALLSVCSTVMPLLANANRGCLTKELLVSLSKAWHVL
jgi:hypothetical protein